jgi:hypothetical protein
MILNGKIESRKLPAGVCVTKVTSKAEESPATLSSAKPDARLNTTVSTPPTLGGK